MKRWISLYQKERVGVSCPGHERGNKCECKPDHQVFDVVAHLPVPKLMTQDGNNLLLVHLFNEGVKEDHSLVLEESIEISFLENNWSVPLFCSLHDGHFSYHWNGCFASIRLSQTICSGGNPFCEPTPLFSPSKSRPSEARLY